MEDGHMGKSEEMVVSWLLIWVKNAWLIHVNVWQKPL